MFLGKAVDDELGNQLVATMLYLDSENKKDINIYINCSGGEVRVSLSTSIRQHSSVDCWSTQRMVSTLLSQRYGCSRW